MNILFVEDEEDIVKSVLREFKRQKDIQFLPHCEFDDIDKKLSKYKVDLIILDLSNGIENDTEAGKQIITKIYAQSFLPIIIYSGYSNIFENPFKDNYFIRTVKKGPNGISELKKVIQEFLPFIKKKILVSKEIDTDISEIYRYTYQKMISNTRLKNTSKKTEIFTRLMKRRLAASIDEPTENKINAWEIYLYPCLGKDYLTGDILRKKKASKKDPSSYRLILSPSCDLQKHIQNVKVTCFINIADKFKKNDLKSVKLLRDTSPEQYMFFHKLEGEFPHMICDFKKIEVIEFKKLTEIFERVASIDSPFREAIAWADMTINNRPGLPDRDCEAWLESIKTDCFPIPQ